MIWHMKVLIQRRKMTARDQRIFEDQLPKTNNVFFFIIQYDYVHWFFAIIELPVYKAHAFLDFLLISIFLYFGYWTSKGWKYKLGGSNCFNKNFLKYFFYLIQHI